MALACHDLPRRKNDQLSSLLGSIVKRCMDPTFHDKFQIKKMYKESHDVMTKYIRGVNSIINTLPFLKVISYNGFVCIELNETINHILGQGIELKSLHIDTNSDWVHPDTRKKSEFLKKIRGKVEYQVKRNSMPQNTRAYLMRLWSDGFHPYNVIILSSSSLQLFTVTIAHAEKYSTRFTSPFALGNKAIKRFKNIPYRYCKNLWKIPSKVHWQVISNDYPERCYNTSTLQNGLNSKRWIPSCKNCLKRRLCTVIPYFKNAVIDKGEFKVCDDWWTDLSNKNR